MKRGRKKGKKIGRMGKFKFGYHSINRRGFKAKAILELAGL